MSANPIDITTVAAVKSWIAPATTSTEDQVIQDCITAFSAYVLKLTARGPADGSIPTTSPFATPVAYDECFDGNGNDTLPLNNWPITAVSSVNDSGRIIPASTGLTSSGYVVDQSKKFLVLRGFTGYGAGYNYRAPLYCRMGWTLGTQNIQVAYTAGFAAIPFDLEMVARKVVSLNYRRRNWIGQSSQAMAMGAGTIVANKWEMDDQDKRVISYYMARFA